MLLIKEFPCAHVKIRQCKTFRIKSVFITIEEPLLCPLTQNGFDALRCIV